MEQKVIAREYISNTRCDVQEDGTWKAFNEVKDRVLLEGATEWIEESVNAMAYDDAPEEAVKTAMNSVLAYIVQNVYQKGFRGLVDYRAYERQLEEGRKAKDVNTEAESI
jgi:hypothetical protein